MTGGSDDVQDWTTRRGLPTQRHNTPSSVKDRMSEHPRAAPQQQRARETRAAVLEGAARVFSSLTYAQARLKDISEASGVSAGSMYFHFGSKGEIAAAVLEEQEERMTAVLTSVLARDGNGQQKLLWLVRDMGELISSDAIVQGGISLAGQPNADVAGMAKAPYFEWVRIVRTLIGQGIDDGSIAPDVDVESAAEFVNALFIGTQVLSGLEDSWKSFPARLKMIERYMLEPFRIGDFRHS